MIASNNRPWLPAGAAYLILAAFAVWVYAPGIPFAYPGIEDLLLGTYRSAATPLPLMPMYLRLLALLVFSVGILVALMAAPSRTGGALLSGVLAATPLCLPAFVPFVLGGEASIATLATLAIILAMVSPIRGASGRLGAVAAPAAALVFCVAVVAGVRSSAEVALRSAPPLFVLADAVRNPDDRAARLALGMHLLSIGGDREAEPILRAVGRELAEHYAQQGNPELSEVARRIARWSAASEAEQSENAQQHAQESSRL